jgi:hypothetical protein
MIIITPNTKLEIDDVVRKNNIMNTVIDINKEYIRPVYTLEEHNTHRIFDCTIMDLLGAEQLKYIK